MSDLWPRLRQARLVRVLLVYGAASWLILQLTALLREEFQLPQWLTPVAAVLLLIGLIIIVATAWIQAHPPAAAHEVEGPTPWEVDLVDLKESVAKGQLPRLTWARVILGGVFAFSLLFGFAGLYVLLSERGPASGPSDEEGAAAPGIAVLPFRVVGPEMELWREGMVDLLSTNLDGAAGLRAVDPRAVLSRWRTEIGEGVEAADREAALQVARGVGASYALMGSMVGSGQEVRLTAEVYELGSGDLQGTTRLEGSPDSILGLVDALSMEVLRTGLVQGVSELPQLSLSRVTTSSVDALKAYLSGEQHYRASRWEDAAVDFTRAVEADSTFALALYRLSSAYGWIEAFSPRVIEYTRRAAQHSDRLPTRVALLLRGNGEMDEGRLTAITVLEELTTRYPDDAEGWYLLGEAYIHVGFQGLHGQEKFRNAFRRAIELDPSFGPAYSHLVHDAFYRQDSGDARGLIAAVRRIDASSPETRGFELAFGLLWGDSAAEADAAAALDSADDEALSAAHLCFLFQADFAEKLRLVARARTAERRSLFSRQAGHDGISKAYLYQGRLGESRAALAEMPGSDRTIQRLYLLMHLAGYANTPTASAAAQALTSDPAPMDRFLIGGFAATEGRWADVDAEVRVLEANAESAPSPGDSLEAAESRALARALRGYAALRRGEGETAIRELGAALPELPGIGPEFVRTHTHAVLRHELGRLFLELGRAQEAEPYFRSVEFEPQVVGSQVEFYLGQVYEALGDPEEAKRHYARFVRLWENCDPELRPLWERGREALERLTRESAS